jgi:CO/xanthine dehydrogenase FAD-binding subunit
MKHFEYHEPKTIQDVCALLSRFGEEASILAGGTDLIVQMKRGRLTPKQVINIKKIKGLDFISENGVSYKLGALVSIADIAMHSGLQRSFPIVVNSAKSIGSAQIRNLATLGGNLCNASPSADMSPSLLVLEAKVRIVGLQESRILPIEDFFLGPGRVDLNREEILAEIVLPFAPKNTKMIYYKLGPRKAMDCAIVSVAVAIGLNDATGECEKARIALGAVAPTPVRVREAEKLVEGKVAQHIPLSKIGEIVRRQIAPISDVRGSAEYRYETAMKLTLRAIKILMNLS